MTLETRTRRKGSSYPTIAEVAALAGVSPMTVSRTINGSVRVKESTRNRVEQAITELGYRPNIAARQLAGGQLCRICLLYNNPSSSYLSEILIGALESVAAAEAELILQRCHESDIPNIGAALIAQRIDALILPPPLSDHGELLDQLSQLDLIAAMLATTRRHDRGFSIALDDAAAAHAMTCHLIEQGHQQIGFIRGDPNQVASAARATGFHRAIAEHGLSAQEGHIADGDFSFKSGFLAAERILSHPNPPTAIFASNDDMAAGAVAAARRFDLKVPSQLSVCGFDDTSMAISTWPELSTIKQPVSEMTRLAVEMLVRAHRDSRKAQQLRAQHFVLDFELIQRASVARVG